MREQVERLKDHAHAAAHLLGLFFGDVPTVFDERQTVDEDAAVADRFESDEAAEQGTFAGAGGTDNGDDLTGCNIEVDSSKHLVVAEGLFDADRVNGIDAGIDAVFYFFHIRSPLRT